jgi:uncharacterized repeat protein (TIGR01451 family)/gliding motility-associated-like protein
MIPLPSEAPASATKPVTSDPRQGRFSRFRSLAGRWVGLLVLVLAGLLPLPGRVLAQSNSVDLSLSMTVSASTPQPGDVLTYTLTVRNTSANAADSVEVTDRVPLAGAEYVSATLLRGGKAWSYANGTGRWDVGTLAPNDSARLTLQVRVTGEGVWFNQAFVSRQKQPDVDSKPGNEDLTEDDYANACFSVPVTLYPDEEITVSLPAGVGAVAWTKDGQPLTASTPASTVVLNPDGSLTIRATGTYQFTATLGTCPAGGCCPIVVVPGSFGSIGGMVWKDYNGDGIRNPGLDGIAGVTVRLLDSTGTNVLKTRLTDGKGLYRFDSLLQGRYRAEFVKPTGMDAVPLMAVGNPAIASMADPTTGRTGLIFVNLSKDAPDSLRKYANVNAGFMPPCEKPQATPTLAAQTICAGDSNGVARYRLQFTGNDENLYAQWYAPTLSNKTLGAPLAGEIHAHFRPTAAQLPPADGKTYYYAVTLRRYRLDACADTVWVAMTVKPGLTAPTVASVPLACAGSAVSLVATSAGNDIRWYGSAKATTPLTSTKSGEAYAVVADSSRSYFAEAVATGGGCASPRTEVFVGVNPKPAKPTGLTALTNTCPDSTVNLAAALRGLKPSKSGNTFEWHLGALSSSARFTDSLDAKTMTLYLFEKSPEGCFSEPQAVSVTISNCRCAEQMAFTLTAPESACGGPIDISVKPVGKTLTGLWSSTGSGQFTSLSALTNRYVPSKADSAAGTVTITFTSIDPDGNGPCQPEVRSVVVKLNGTPAAPSVSADTTVCAGASVALSAKAAPGTTIQWFTAPTGGTALGSHPSGGFLNVKPTQTTTYYAEATGSTCGNSPRTAVKVTTQACAEPKIDLTLVKQVSDPNPVVGDTVTYTLEVQNAGPATATGVELRDAWPAGLQFIDGKNITKTDSVLTATVASLEAGKFVRFTYRAKVTGTQPITNRAQVFKANEKDAHSTFGNGYANGEKDESSATLTPRATCAPKAPAISAAKSTVLTSECVLLTAKGCETGLVQWSTGESGQTLTVCPTKTTSYTATCAVKGCTSAASEPVTIAVTTLEAPVVKAAADTVCATGSGTTLTATGCANGTVAWSNGQTGTSITVKPLSTTTYSAVCQVSGQKSATSNAVTVTVATPVVPIVGATATDICPGASTILTAYGCAGKVVWSSGEVGASITVKPTKTTTYTAVCQVGECTSAKSNQLVVNVLSGVVPVVSASASSLCASGSVTLTATGCSGGVQWSNGLSGYVVTVNEPGSYSAKCVGAGCTSDYSKPVVIKSGAAPAAPTLSASKTNICFGESVTLTAKGCDNGTVTWNTGKSGASLTVSPDSTRNFTATCTLDGCTSPAASALTVVVNKALAPLISANKTVVDKGGSVTLTAKGCENGIVTWNNIHAGNPFTVSPGETTTYTATCTVGECVSPASEPLTVTVKCLTLPAAPKLAASQNPVLKGQSVLLTAQGCAGGTITWNTGTTGDSLRLTPAATARFTATCTLNGCTSLRSDTLTVNVTECPPLKALIVVAKGNATLCAGESVTLVAHGCTGTITWSTGVKGDTLVVSPTATTTYSATCTVGQCVSPLSNEQLVTVITPAVPVVTASKDTVKTGTPVTLTASGCNGTVIWSNGGIGLTLTVKVTADTVFTARCAVDRCTSAPSKPVKLTLDTRGDCKTAPTISATKTTVCKGESVTLTAKGCDGGTVVWNGVYAGKSYLVSPGETITYTATCSVDGCTSPKSEGLTITVDKPAAPTVLVANPTNACPAQTVDLTKTVDASGPGAVLFYTGVTIGSPKVEKPDSAGAGTYYAFRQSANGCFSDPVTVVATLTACAPPKLPAQLALAKALVDSSRRQNGSYDLTYQFKISNLGKTTLRQFVLRDSLTNAFTGLPFKVVDGSVQSAGLTPNPGFNGESNPVVASADSLAAGASESVKFTVNVAFGTPALGVYRNIAHGAAKTPDGTPVTDWSNNGFEPKPGEDSPTPIAFGLPGTRLGIAKRVVDAPVKLADRLYRVTYEIRATNFGRTDLMKVRLTDDLAAAFAGKGATVDSVRVAADAGFTPNAAYTGQPGGTDLLVDSLSTLPVGTTRAVRLTLRVNVAAATDSVFHNTALGRGWDSDGNSSEDASTKGLFADPNHDGNPGSNVPTDVTLKLRQAALQATLGLAMKADTARQPDGSYRVDYTLTLRNYGDQPIASVQVTDSLSRAFTGIASYAVGQPTVGTGSTLTPNPAFNGDNDPALLIAEQSRLAPRATETLRFTLTVTPDGRREPYLNSAFATGLYADSIKVFDTSTNGLDPAPNGLPASAFEPTPVTLPVSGDAEVFIPEGFSPNGDGVNDRFVIRNTGGASVSLQVFNRWGQVVFASDDYKNDWDGRANRGAAFGPNGLPDGTYYYVVRLSDGRQFTRYLTLMR